MLNTKKLKLIVISIMLLLGMYMLTGCEFLNKDLEDNEEEKIKIEAYEEPLENIINGLVKADSETFLKAFPDFIVVHMQDIYTDEYLEGVAKVLKDEYGDNVKMSYKIKEKIDIDADALRNVENEMRNNFEKKVTITRGYELKVDVTTKGKNAEDTKDDVFKVFEIDGKWYILDL